MKKNRFFQTFVFSTVGVIAMGLLLIVLNFVAGAFHARVDVTDEGLYTLSAGTEAILEEIDTPVTIRFYYSKDVQNMPMGLKNYARRVQDLLREYREAADGGIAIEKFNPTPLSDAADAAELDGVYGQTIGLAAEPIYLGLSVNLLDRQETLSFLHPENAESLEYDITRAINRVLHPQKPVIGLMTALPVAGGPAGGMPMMQQQGAQPWQFYQELRQDFELRTLSPGGLDAIPEEIDVLILMHPTDLDDQTMFALDQFVLRGGKLLAMLDPLAFAVQASAGRQPSQRPPNPASDLEPLLSAWGMEFDPGTVVVDMLYAAQIRDPRSGETVRLPSLLELPNEALAQEEPVTAELSHLYVRLAGAFSGDGLASLEKTVLVHSSPQAQLIPKWQAQGDPEQIKKQFQPADKAFALAVQLTGRFETAFPDGPPQDEQEAEAADSEIETNPAEENPEQPVESSEESGDGEQEQSKPAALTESAEDGAVILIGDVDLAHDHLCVQTQQVFGQQFAVAISDNIALLLNLVDRLTGGRHMMAVRSRGEARRPFKVINEMEVQAEQAYQDRIVVLEQELQRVRQRLNELQRGRGDTGDGQEFVLSPEQRQTIERFRKKQVETRKELKELQKQLRKDIDSLQTGLKWANIGLMPAVVCLVGLGIAIIKHRRVRT